MKKFIAVIISACIFLSLASCDGTGSVTTTNKTADVATDGVTTTNEVTAPTTVYDSIVTDTATLDSVPDMMTTDDFMSDSSIFDPIATFESDAVAVTE